MYVVVTVSPFTKVQVKQKFVFILKIVCPKKRVRVDFYLFRLSKKIANMLIIRSFEKVHFQYLGMTSSSFNLISRAGSSINKE